VNLELRQVTPVIGSEVIDLDLERATLDTMNAIKRALNERMVLVFRDQHLSRDAHKRLGRFFGTGVLHQHKLVPKGQDPDIIAIKNDADSKYAIGDGWHTDVSCDETPISTSMLYMTQVPENGGGDTIFANMNLAYQTLSAPIKALMGSLQALHDGALPWKAAYGIDPAPGTQYPTHVHPVVIAHPETGKSILWVNRGFTSRIRGVTERESRFLLEMLLNHIESTPLIQCRVRWEANTLLMWDNIATQHHAVWDYFPMTRYGERVSSVGGPLSAAA
jgi:taurine dioxygenase